MIQPPLSRLINGVKITVRVKPGAKHASIEKIDDENFFISVKEPPIEGRANKAVLKALAEYFGKSPSQISIIGGQTSKIKIIEIT